MGVAKALDSRTAKLCCLAKDCANAEYSNLVRALCDEGGVSLVMVDEGAQLGGLRDGVRRGHVGSQRAADVPQGAGARGQVDLQGGARSTIREVRARNTLVL